MADELKFAIVHDYLHTYGGAEALLNAIWEVFPSADIYSSTYNPEVMKKVGAFQGAQIFYPAWKNSIPGIIKNLVHKVLIANLPVYFENLDLGKYDVIISSTAHFAKGVITHPNQLHISYIHTPPRFLYKYQGETSKRESRIWKIFLNPLDSYLRLVDYNFAQRPDFLLCNSEEVKKRIKKFYKRKATVINPFPQVNVTEEKFKEAIETKGDYYLIVSRLAAYKNIDLAIKVCGENNIPLIIAGTGSSESKLKSLASKYKSVKMLGLVSQDKKEKLYINCKGFLCTVKDEDFGMAPLEPMMFGKPVIALKSSGYLETVVDGKTGVFFENLTENSLLKGINEFEHIQFDSLKIRKHAEKFSKERFKSEFRLYVKDKIEEYLKQ
jgi:glycosyltransferase involved in cell wall biosynthesis